MSGVFKRAPSGYEPAAPVPRGLPASMPTLKARPGGRQRLSARLGQPRCPGPVISLPWLQISPVKETDPPSAASARNAGERGLALPTGPCPHALHLYRAPRAQVPLRPALCLLRGQPHRPRVAPRLCPLFLNSSGAMSRSGRLPGTPVGPSAWSFLLCGGGPGRGFPSTAGADL